MPRATHYLQDKTRVLDVINAAHIAHARPPTVRILAEECGVGVATMHSYLCKMAEEGLVDWTQGARRSLRVTDVGLKQLSA